ncbi:MAG: CARDB domain-containing protein, partial [Cytophagaceae bacterium]
SVNDTYESEDISLGSFNTSGLSANSLSTFTRIVSIPVNTTPGTYYIIVRADINNVIWETNKNNNINVIEITVLPPAPDLIINNLTVQAHVDVGATMPYSCTVRNQGHVDASSSNVAFYLSSNSSYEEDDLLLGISEGGALNKTSNSGRSGTFTIPESVIPGDYFLLAFADYNNQVEEGNEDNNISSREIIVYPSGTNVNVPVSGSQTVTMCSGFVHDNGGMAGDYVGNSNGMLTINPSIPGNKVKLEFTSFLTQEMNIFDYLIIYNGTNSSAPSLGTFAHTNSPGTIYGTSPSGALTLRFISDAHHHYAGFSATVSCVEEAPMPDLIVTSFSTTTTSIAPEVPFETNYSIRNQGTGASRTAPRSGFYLSIDDVWDSEDLFLDHFGSTNIAAGATFNGTTGIKIPENTPPGEYYLIIYTDYDHKVYELDETNNTRASQSITVIPLIRDLIIIDPIIPSQNIQVGATFPVTSYVKNEGNSRADPSVIGFYLSNNETYDPGDILLDARPVSLLHGGNTSTQIYSNLTIPANTEPGIYYILFYADHQNVVAETDETNNIVAFQIQVWPEGTNVLMPHAGTSSVTRCDGILYDVGGYGNTWFNSNGTLIINPSTEGSKVSLTFNSFRTMSAWQYLSIYNGNSTSAPLIGTYSNSELQPSSVFYGSNDGSLTLRFVSNGSGQGSGFEAMIGCVENVPLPDLVLTSPHGPQTLLSGSNPTYACRIINQGNYMAFTSNIGFYLSNDMVWDEDDILLGTRSGGLLNVEEEQSRGASVIIPIDTPPGDYFIIYYADYSNVEAEEDKTNNFTYLPITIIPPAADLRIISPTVNPRVVEANSTISVSCNIRNEGNAVAGSSNVGYYLSDNITWDENDVFLGFSAGAQLAAFTSSAKSQTLTIPANIPAGNYFILFYADYTDEVVELSENNNVNNTTITIIPEGSTVLVPFSGTSSVTSCAGMVYDHGGPNGNYANNADGSLVINPETEGGKVRLTFSSFNMEANYDFVYIYHGPSVKATPDRTFTGTTLPAAITSSHPGGALTIRLKSDFTGTRAGFAASFSCVIPDLIIQNPTVDPVMASPGSEITVTSSVRNQGSLNAPSSMVGYYLSEDETYDENDVFLGNSTGISLVAGTAGTRTSTVSVPLETTPGNYYILFFADFENSVAEENETNNISAVAFEVTESALHVDLLLQNPELSTTSLTRGDNMEVSVSIHNSGNGAASSSNVGYYLSTNAVWDAEDVFLGRSLGATLAAGASDTRSATVIIPEGTTAGHYYIIFFADHENLVVESNEDNNISALPFTFTDLVVVDLLLQSPLVSSASVLRGGSVDVYVDIHNSGNGAASSSNVGYYLSTNAVWDAEDVFLGWSSGATLAAGASDTRSATVTIPEGTTAGGYYIIFFADHENLVVESNEDNNTAAKAITITDPLTVDLLLQNPYVSTTSVAGGEDFNVS